MLNITAATRLTRAVSGARSIAMLPAAGPGGRSSVSGIVATVFGATGFLGRYVVNNFGRIGSQVIVPFRGDEHAYRHLRPMADLGQMIFQDYSLMNEARLKELVKHSNVVVNLVGQHRETRHFSLDDVHMDGARLLARACRQAGVERLIHVSALNACEKSSSEFLRTKAYGEHAVRAEFPNATIIRPANMFGDEDRFLNQLATLRQQFHISMIFPNGGESTKQPVYVGDVARGIVAAARDATTRGKTLEFFGPKTYTMNKIMELVNTSTRRPHRVVPLPVPIPDEILYKFAKLTEMNPLWTHLCEEDMRRWRESDVVHSDTGRLEDLKITPTNMESLLVPILRRYRHYLTHNEAVE